MRQVIVRATLATAAIGLGLALYPGAAQATSSTGWQVAYRSRSAAANQLYSVTAPSASDAWAVGVTGSGSAVQPLILNWNGSAWNPVTIPGTAGFAPGLVESTSADDVWIFGSSNGVPEALAWNGSSWQTITLPAYFGGGPAAVVSSSDVWGAQGSNCTGGTCTTTAWHWDGTAWTSTQVNGLIEDMTAADGHAWVLTLTSLQDLNTNPTGLPTVYQSSGSVLQPVSVPAPATRIAGSAGIAASPADQLWMTGPPATTKTRPLLFHWTGQDWTQSPIPAKVPGSSEPFIVNFAVTYDGQKGVWAGPYAHWTGTRWLNTNQVASLPVADSVGLLGVASIPGSASAWSVGWAGHSRTNNTHDSLIAVYGGLP